MIFGVDVASWQGYPNWNQLAAEGHDFMISKVTGENNYVNPYAVDNLARADAAGMITGGYDWVEPQRAGFLLTGEDAARDYLRTLDRLGAWRPGFLLTVDFETPEWFTGPLGRNIEEYMRRYFLALLDVQKVITYTAPYFLAETGAKDWAWLTKTLYWIAAPGGDAMLPDNAAWPSGSLVRPWEKATIHQHQWHAKSPAVVGTFDRNRFNGTRKQLFALGYKGEVVPPVEEEDVKEPPSGKLTTYINAKGETLLVINYGGSAKNILGTNVADVGVSVINEQAEVYDGTVRANEFLPWKRRA